MGAFEKAHAFVAEWEGGFVDDPADPGGATRFGISLRFLQAQGLDVGDLDLDGDIDADDIRLLTSQLAADIMRRAFWDSFPLDAVQPPMATAVYDTAVNMGCRKAKTLAQRALGVEPDGMWGPQTWDALSKHGDRSAALALLSYRRTAYDELIRRNGKLQKFRRGWLARVSALEALIKEL
jgi:lysozyme family protein